MSQSQPLSRRQAMKLAALSALSAPLLARGADVSPPADWVKSKLKLGVATYSLHDQTPDQVIADLKQLEIDSASLYKSHCPWNTGSVADCQAAVKKFTDAGIAVTSTGVIDLTKDEAAARRAFENVKGAGLSLFAGRPTLEALPLVDKLVKEYDVKVAIHNHGPTDLYPTGDEACAAVQSFDPRIGLCLDVGHAWRAGGDPAATIRKAHDRLFQVHLKDTRGPKTTHATGDPTPVIVGRGLVNIKAILAALLEINYPHHVDFEYEEKAADKMPGLSESVGYTRGMLAAL